MKTTPWRNLKYDFDMHNDERGYYHFFVKNYMEMVHTGLQEVPYSFKGKTVYDIGVGRGRAFPIYQSLGINKVIGFDVDEHWVEFAREKAKKFGLDLEVRMNHDNKAIKALENDSCDVVSLMYILSFYPGIKKELIEEAKRIVKPGGLVIVMDVPKPSMMSRLNTLCCMPRTFSSIPEWKALFNPLKMIGLKGSNYWYFLNAPMDIVGKFFGPKSYRIFDSMAKRLGTSPSTSLMVFQK